MVVPLQGFMRTVINEQKHTITRMICLAYHSFNIAVNHVNVLVNDASSLFPCRLCESKRWLLPLHLQSLCHELLSELCLPVLE